MADVRVLVLRAAGINCDEEVMHCWRLSGADPTLVHVNTLAQSPSMLESCDIVTIPGGFSYGDDIAAGTILAQRLIHDVAGEMSRLVERGGGILGICNGFQVLVKMGLLPGGEGPGRVTVTYNHSARFEARWVTMEVCTDRCPFLHAGAPGGLARRGDGRGNRARLEMPVEHAEGRVVTANDAVLAYLESQGCIALRYVDKDGNPDRYPANPNGSAAGIAGLCDLTGRIFGLMPHPDRNFDRTHHPCWTRHERAAPPDGLSLFQNAVTHWSH